MRRNNLKTARVNQFEGLSYEIILDYIYIHLYIIILNFKTIIDIIKILQNINICSIAFENVNNFVFN